MAWREASGSSSLIIRAGLNSIARPRLNMLLVAELEDRYQELRNARTIWVSLVGQC